MFFITKHVYLVSRQVEARYDVTDGKPRNTGITVSNAILNMAVSSNSPVAYL